MIRCEEEDTAKETREQRNARLDAEYERGLARLPEETREWLESVVGCIELGFEIEASEYVEET
ncbi:MAG: hypothetical protein GF393_01135 [Armatimonadia bacterium]|nr:hypothetical protein [Armatimonadia bacterium]